MTTGSPLGGAVTDESVGTAGLSTWLFTAVLAAAVLVIFGSPVFGWFPVVRVSAVLWTVGLAACLMARPSRWNDAQWTRAAQWVPSKRAVVFGSATIGVLLFWMVYSRFQAGGIDAVDFTVYFDRPLYQTSRGRMLWVESSDDPRFADLTHLAVHAYWILLPLALFYWVHPTPMWLLGLSVVAVTIGAIYVFRILRSCGAGGALSVAAAVAFVSNGNTARALNYGFHAEILYAWFVPWALDAGLRRARIPFLGAVIACVLVKEDAIFPLVGVSVALALLGAKGMTIVERIIYLVAPPALAVANLVSFYELVVPWLSPDGQVMYAYFWSRHGNTPWEAARSLLTQPVQLAQGAITSGFFGLVLSRHFYLPLIGWRWIVGLLPVALVYGASDNHQLRGFGIYYAVPFVPFLAIATAVGARTLTRSVLRGPIAEVTAAGLVVASAWSIGLGYSLRPWKGELGAVRHALIALGSQDKVFVQGELYPHAGYDRHVQLLTAHDVQAQASQSAVILLASRGSAYPLRKNQWRCLTSLPRLSAMPGGLLAVPVTATARQCVSSLKP